MALPVEQLRTLPLGLRTFSFDRELAGMKLPTDALALVELMRAERERSLEGRYNMVFIFTQLERKGGAYWTAFGYKSTEELLTRLDLPVTDTLGRWSTLVQLFSKETILMLGEDSLWLLTRMIIAAQPDSDLRKRDYHAILDEYSRTHGSFDKTKFEKTVNWYINTKYVKPSGIRVIDNTARPVLERDPIRTTRTSKPIGREEAQQMKPILTSDFVMEQKIDGWRDAALSHIAFLERIIKNSLGDKAVPGRPMILRQ